MYRIDQQNHNLQTALTDYLVQIIIHIKCSVTTDRPKRCHTGHTS